MEVKKITKPADVMYRAVMFDDGYYLIHGFVPDARAMPGAIIDGRTVSWCSLYALTEQEYFEWLLNEHSESGKFLAETRKF